MGQQHCIVKSRKNKHLNYRERLRIEIMLNEKKKSSEIAAALSCSKRTIEREVKRGQVQKLDGKTWIYYMAYDADIAQNDYMSKRGGSGPGLKIGHDHKLCNEIEKQIKLKNSPDVIAQNINSRVDEFKVTLSTRTIYNYLEKNIFLSVDYKDLIYGHYKKKRGDNLNRPSYKNIRGRSIEERPVEANERTETGHWEMDLVVSGRRNGTACGLPPILGPVLMLVSTQSWYASLF